jgi:photosystem II stability/assembly factor-like uncharacterized protein
VRYGSFPSEKVWFVSSGVWGEDPPTLSDPATPSPSAPFKLSARASITEEGGAVDIGEDRVVGGKASHSPLSPPSAATSETGWFGAVSKSSDGGKTWETVLLTDLSADYVYFNGISCVSELQCVVVGEGYTASSVPLTVAYSTFDGGKSWQLAHSSNDVSMMGVKLTSPTEGYLMGTAKKGRNLSGQFWATSDGGKSFALKESFSNCFAIDFDFSQDGLGVAACSSSSGASCSVAFYK